MKLHGSLVRAASLAATCVACLAASASAGNSNGVAGAMTAYYDDELFVINFKEMPADAEQSLLDHNSSINTIYTSEATLPDGSMFVAVLDAIQGDGFNPLWQEVEITFADGVTPSQFTSDDDVLAAAAAGDVELSSTGEVYRCAVIGADKILDAMGSADVGSSSGGGGGSDNGSGSDMPALYDGDLLTINFKAEPDQAAASLLAHNGSINTIYMSDAGLPGGEPFVAVLDAIQGDGFNPLWLEVQVTFNAGFTPRQLMSDDEVLDAAASGEVSLSSDGEIYRCSVVGPKK
jgi:hypothetical protein